MNTVYALMDPMTHEVKYIGATKNFKLRIAQHAGTKSATKISAWVQRLSCKPEAVELETGLTKEAASHAESFWIEYFRMIGANLLNVSRGGFPKKVSTLETPKNIQLRDVDGQLHAAVKGKAAALGLTMEAFIIRLMQEGVK